jgi:hypothetical protein
MCLFLFITFIGENIGGNVLSLNLVTKIQSRLENYSEVNMNYFNIFLFFSFDEERSTLQC